MKEKIEFIDLSLRPQILDFKIINSIKQIVKNNTFIMGDYINKLESKITNISKNKYSLTCSNGTDALMMALMALDIKKNDIVFVPSYTFASTAESVAILGAVPFFVDISKETFNIDLQDLEFAINKAIKYKYNIKCIIAVDLFGMPCDYQQIKNISKKYNISFIADCAQNFGNLYNKNNICKFADIMTTSFFPTKPLGSFGEGGALFTDNYEIYKKLISIRNHGSGANKYENIYIGMNARLDTIQAAIILEKIKTYKKETNMRNKLAKFYNKYFQNYINLQIISKNINSLWSQYSLVFSSKYIRDDIKNSLEKENIKYNTYYHIPLHMQKAYNNFPRSKQNLKNSENLSETILNLPIYPYINTIKTNKIVLIILKYLTNFCTT